MKMTVYNPTNEKIAVIKHGRQVIIGPKSSEVLSEKMATAVLVADERLRTDTADYTPDQVAEVDKLRKPALIYLCKSLMRGSHPTPAEAEAAVAAESKADSREDFSPDPGADETGQYETSNAE